MQAIYLYSLADGKATQVTDGMSDAESPVFDKNGKYLYFTASTNSGAAMEPDIESFSRPVTASVYVVVLSKDRSLAVGAGERRREKGRGQEGRAEERRRQERPIEDQETQDKTKARTRWR